MCASDHIIYSKIYFHRYKYITSYSFKHGLLYVKVRTRFTITWWICSNITLDMRFTEVLGLAVIPYSSSDRYFLNSRPINYFPWSYVIYISLGYLDRHIVSTKFAINISILSSYHITPNHPVTGSISVTNFRCKFSFLPFCRRVL